jgi:serine/threonine protein kinase
MTSSRARALLEDFLARMDSGELPDFEALARAHPDLEAELRAAFASECVRLESAESSAGRDDPLAPGVDDDVFARLVRRGADFERYVPRGEIGKGGMGVVLHVFDADLRRDLALKIVSNDARSLDRAALARFLEEAQVTSQLDHPGIVPVHEIAIDPAGRLYFTMKLVKGRTFAEVLELVREKREGWTLARALGVIQRVCEAMAYAHQKGVLHRDLKPANVMVGAFGEVYVMDWGLARIVGSTASDDVSAERGPHVSVSRVDSDRAARRGLDPSSSLLTADGQVVGTPAYMPPEQAAGRQAGGDRPALGRVRSRRDALPLARRSASAPRPRAS